MAIPCTSQSSPQQQQQQQSCVIDLRFAPEIRTSFRQYFLCYFFFVLHNQLPGGGGREFQRLVGYARLLAELYNYAVVGSPTVFETLHLLLDSGHEVRVRNGA